MAQSRIAQVEGIIFSKSKNNYKFLLLRRIPEKGGFWQPVTGGVEKGETILDTLKRDVFEETGIKEIKNIIENVHKFDLKDSKGNIYPEYVFGVEVSENININLSENIYPEHNEFKWCSFDEALSLLKWDGNKEGLRKLYSIFNRN